MTEYSIDTRIPIQETDANDVSPLSESSRSSADHSLSFMHDAMRAERKQQDLESLTLLLNHLDHYDEETHDEEVKQGLASFLVKVLHKTLRRTNPGESGWLDSVYRDHLRRSRALRVSIICTALEMVLRCSDSAMNAFVRTMPLETIPTLVILVEIFSSDNGSRTVRDVVLNKAARILCCLCTHGIPIRIVLVEALFALFLKGEMDTKIDAACALASIASRRSDKLHHSIIPRIEKISYSLISTLSTAASSLPGDQVECVLDALLNLSNSSDCILVNTARRNGTMHMLNQSMKSRRPEIRRNAMVIAERLLRCVTGFTELFSAQPHNGETLVRGLASAAMNDDETELQHFATCILTKSLANMNGSLQHTQIIMDALAVVASAAVQDRTAHEAALGFCNKAPVLEKPHSQETALVGLSELAQSSSKLIRSEALRALGRLCSRSNVRCFLATQDSFHGAIVSNVTEGTEVQAYAAMTLLEQIACEQQNRKAICRSSLLIDLVVDTAVRNPTKSNRSYMTSVELLLLLMSDDSSITSFLHYADLLPWLATLANSNASSKKLKKDTIDAIVRLTSQFLE